MAKIVSKWYIYLLSFFIAVTSFCVVTTVKTNPKETERINFVVGAVDINSYQLEAKLKENKPKGIKKISCNFLRLHSQNFNYLFTTLRSNSDFFILPYNYIVNEFKGITDYAANIDTTYVNEKLGEELDYCSFDDHYKGFKIYDSSLDEGILKDYITYNFEDEKDDYYLFFSFKSKNIGELNHSKSENAYEVIKEMMAL